MNSLRKILSILLLVISSYVSAQKQKVIIAVDTQIQNNPRVKFGVERLSAAFKQKGYEVTVTNKNLRDSTKGNFIAIAKPLSKWLWKVIRLHKPNYSYGKEQYSFQEKYSVHLVNSRKNSFYGEISAEHPSGFLYGCLALADSIKVGMKLSFPLKDSSKLSVAYREIQNDKMAPYVYKQFGGLPRMLMRGTCIGIQKPYYLPGRHVYEYPYTPETFPWFYDKKMWTQYLDSLVENRMNSLYLWNGHPFASLVKLKDYPYAVEVSDETFKKNEEIYRFITEEADKRGIWVIQMFYNIIVSKPFAEHHNIKTQDRNRPIIPLIADYTRKSIAAFVEKYPNVGLMVCLGEAMEGVGQDDIEWFTKTIIPGVKDGLKALGKTEEPPIVLRAHDTNAPDVITAAKHLYNNLYTEAKFNGEALTTYEPRGTWAELHRTLAHLGSVQIENVHILANLEPFRYGATDFIQKSVKGMLTIMEGKGLHLYPQASYWDFPYTADSVKGKRLLQIERDWIWNKAWARYAWNANRDSLGEVKYWSGLLAAKFGCPTNSANKILEAYNQSGEISPKILRRFGITDGNRQTMTLGMLMTQLINPYRYGLFDLLYDAESPVGEKLIEYAEKEWKHESHIGETPVQIIKEIKEHGRLAVLAIKAAKPFVKNNKEEFERIENDMYSHAAMANHYAYKAEAALLILRYKYSNDVKDLEKALPLLEQSVDYYKQLVELTKGTYLYANSMQTAQRKIPIRGVDGTFKTWAEVLVPFENELVHFKHKIDSLKQNKAVVNIGVKKLQNASIDFSEYVDELPMYNIESGAKPFFDTSLSILYYAKELQGLIGFKKHFAGQVQYGTGISFKSRKPVKILVGFFNKKDPQFLKAPELETDASANDYGQSETRIANAIIIKGMPSINVHTYSFKAGKVQLTLAKGACLVLGVINASEQMPLYDAGLTEKGVKKEIDWLFE
jgi:hypothetical protein